MKLIKPLIVHYQSISDNRTVYSQYYVIKSPDRDGYTLIELYSYRKAFRKRVSSKLLTDMIKFNYRTYYPDHLCYCIHNITDLSMINSSQLCKDLVIPLKICERIIEWIENKKRDDSYSLL